MLHRGSSSNLNSMLQHHFHQVHCCIGSPEYEFHFCQLLHGPVQIAMCKFIDTESTQVHSTCGRVLVSLKLFIRVTKEMNYGSHE